MINLAWRVFRWFLAAPSMPRSGGVFYSKQAEKWQKDLHY